MAGAAGAEVEVGPNELQPLSAAHHQDDLDQVHSPVKENNNFQISFC